MVKDYYKALGVDRNASEQEIKQAYRKLSRELHPDRHKGDKSKEEQFKQVNEAYEVLSDPKKKQSYDQFGTETPFGGGGGQGGFSGFSGFSGFDFGSDLGGTIFDSFFGGGSRRRQADAGRRDIQIDVSVTLNEAVAGADRELSFRTLNRCETCEGNGTKKGSKLIDCPVCGGTGQVVRVTQSLFGAIQQSMLCENCRGAGKIPEQPCPDCSGEGRLQSKRTVTVHIPAGVATGQTLKVTGQGEAGRRGTASGNLFVRITVEEDRRFVREGDDISTSISISLTDAVLGAEKEIETVHGAETLIIPEGTQPGTVLRLKGKGMPVVNSGRFGDHYVTAEVEVPGRISKKERELFEELRKLNS